MRLGFTESCLKTFHLQEQNQVKLLYKFSHVLVGFCYPHIFLPFSCFGIFLPDLQPDLSGLGAVIAICTIQISPSS